MRQKVDDDKLEVFKQIGNDFWEEAVEDTKRDLMKRIDPYSFTGKYADSDYSKAQRNLLALKQARLQYLGTLARHISGAFFGANDDETDQEQKEHTEKLLAQALSRINAEDEKDDT